MSAKKRRPFVERAAAGLRFVVWRNHPKNLWRLRSESRFGRRHKVDVAGRIEREELAQKEPLSGQEPGIYEACPEETIHSIFKVLNRRIDVRGYNFVDLGSGKGFVLFLASREPFRNIVGVELSAWLHKIATKNIHTFRDPKQQCEEIRSVCLSADLYEFQEAPLVCFLYNPFGPRVFAPVLQKLEELAARVDVHIVYVNPKNRLLYASKVFKPVEVNPELNYEIWASRA